MTNANTNAGNLHHLFHPAAHYASPDDVLSDAALSASEKRIILSSWASDMFAVELVPPCARYPAWSAPSVSPTSSPHCASWTAMTMTRRAARRPDAVAAALGRRFSEVAGMLTQAVLTMVMLGNVAAAWAVPFVAMSTTLRIEGFSPPRQ